MSTPCPDTRNGTRAEFRAAAATEHKQTTQVPVGLKRRGHRRGGTEGRHTGQRLACREYRMTRMLPPWHAACIGVSRRLAEHCCTSAPPTSTSSRTCMPCVRPRTRVPVCACVRKYTSRHGHAHVHRHVATCMDPRIAHTRARAHAPKLVRACWRAIAHQQQVPVARRQHQRGELVARPRGIRVGAPEPAASPGTMWRVAMLLIASPGRLKKSAPYSTSSRAIATEPSSTAACSAVEPAASRALTSARRSIPISIRFANNRTGSVRR
jgi:hypothetical protein